MRKKTLAYLISSSVLLIITLIFKFINIANYSKGLANSLIFFSLALTIIIAGIALMLKDKLDKKVYQSLDLLWLTLTIISVISFINIFCFSTVNVHQTSMLPTYKEGDILLVSQFNYKPETGDVVIINTKSEELYIKRIMAKEGDLITFNEDEKGIYILINNQIVISPREDEYKYYISSINKDILRTSLRNGKVPKDKFFVLGDNAPYSNDSRHEEIGLIDGKDVIGKVTRKIRGGK